ncbi:MAG: RNA polymerase sigma factor [Parcubacteria group bacterium]|jgi:RNA polymerase sigma-70 factor (ECF subfamily)
MQNKAVKNNAFEKLTDEEIVEKVRLENQEFYAYLMERYQSKLLRYANNLVKDEHRAKDVVQEAFISAFVNLNGFNLKKKFSSWIYRIVHNEALNVLKKYQKELPMLPEFDFESVEDLEKDYSQKEIVAAVEKCLAKLPLAYSEPLALYCIEEKSYEEIGDILKLPQGTVATRISRAKLLMKKVCQKNQ